MPGCSWGFALVMPGCSWELPPWSSHLGGSFRDFALVYWVLGWELPRDALGRAQNCFGVPGGVQLGGLRPGHAWVWLRAALNMPGCSSGASRPGLAA
jgi:hypothetical protein